jgi:hypothetical protein
MLAVFEYFRRIFETKGDLTRGALEMRKRIHFNVINFYNHNFGSYLITNKIPKI